ncbi:hypothetical protein CDAR_599561 [Caerostris darwini]|uniref:Mariner Mos1 transposase n=1 Tax=Caerostris darwini TaxID=1538125 RepID=A0AAV4NW72_9ARAC|nr:hypothetical protein CDAR_599561 [Caerostris darwini]
MTVAKLQELELKLINHPPRAAVLAPTDYHFFRNLDNFLIGKQFYLDNARTESQNSVITPPSSESSKIPGTPSQLPEEQNIPASSSLFIFAGVSASLESLACQIFYEGAGLRHPRVCLGAIEVVTI